MKDMLSKKLKINLYLLLGILLSVLLCVLGCMGLRALNRITRSGEQPPVTSFRVIVDEDQQEVFFEQLRKFAEKHSFDISIRDSGLSEELYVVEMWRDDMRIFIRNPFDPKVFRVGFYDQRFRSPADRVTVNELVDDLKSFVTEIPNAIITEEP